ncbi:hypothetical protein F5884DRAFT_266658 [Xylogone sp. PMI_703]|nr:hypothetical protein F5884DRAFT_266658 [Xylogone sp. PMI_703]
MSIMLLYIHGCMGWGTYSDISRHLDAARSIVELRLLEQSTDLDKPTRPTDILVIESILYHMFHMTTGLWSDLSEPDYVFDLDFWSRAEIRLGQSSSVPGSLMSYNSPVLGVPISLLRLTILLRQQCRMCSIFDVITIENMKADVTTWEKAFLCGRGLQSTWEVNEKQSNIQEEYCWDASSLYVIIVSLLLDQMPLKEPGPPLEFKSGDSRVKAAIEILRKYESDDGWARSFIGNWPAYTLGFFMSRPEDRQVIRADLQRRWKLTNMSQVQRFRSDLENTWTIRQGLVPQSLQLQTLALSKDIHNTIRNFHLHSLRKARV